MWHEARAQEKRLRGFMVDQHKRADRRRKYYEKVKAEPSDFVRINGNSMKIHIDHNIAFQAESPQTMMPWNGDSNNMIDRFDCRVHLDSIDMMSKASAPVEEEKGYNERRTEYERYRILVLNDLQNANEDNFLKQIDLDEQFGSIDSSSTSQKKDDDTKAAIGYVYQDSSELKPDDNSDSDISADSDIEELDMDVAIDLDDLTPEQTYSLNLCSHNYGMETTDYADFMYIDQQDLEMIKEAKQIDLEKSRYSGRQCRKKRKEYKLARQAKKSEFNCIPSALMGGSRSKWSKYKEEEEDEVGHEFTLGNKINLTSRGHNKDSPICVPDENSSPSPPPHASSSFSRQTTSTSAFRKNTRCNDNLRHRSSPNNNYRSRSPNDRYSSKRRSPEVKRYRRPSLSSSAPSEESSEDEEKRPSLITARNNKKIDKILRGRAKANKNMSLREKLEHRMANQLNKTRKQDKKDQRIKEEKEYKDMMDREYDLENLNEEMYRIHQKKLKNRSRSRSCSLYSQGSNSPPPAQYSRSRNSRRSRSPVRRWSPSPRRRSRSKSPRRRSRSRSPRRRSSSRDRRSYRSQRRSRSRDRSRRSRSRDKPRSDRRYGRSSISLVDY